MYKALPAILCQNKLAAVAGSRFIRTQRKLHHCELLLGTSELRKTPAYSQGNVGETVLKFFTKWFLMTPLFYYFWQIITVKSLEMRLETKIYKGKKDHDRKKENGNHIQ